MSMQRSFLTYGIVFFCTLTSVNGHILDNMNEYFRTQLFQAFETDPEIESVQKESRDPVYESEVPEELLNGPRRERDKSLVLRKEDIRFHDIVGQSQAVMNLRSVVEQFRHPERLRLFGGVNKKGIILEGPPGTGKTMLARATANELGYSFHECSASSFVEVFVGTGAQRVRELFEQAHRFAPSIVFIDEIDAIAAADRNESSSNGGLEYRQTLNELLTQMNNITHDSHVMVMCATNTITSVDEAFKAPHRFEIVTIGLPDALGRKETLEYYLQRLPRADISDKAIATVLEKSGGFSQAQIKSLVSSAVQFAVADKDASQVEDMHLLIALEQTRNAMKTGIFGSKDQEYDKVFFNDISGLKDVIKEFEFLVYSLKHPDRIRKFGVTPPKGILLEGPPGCGKTMLVRALANEAHCKVLYASGSSFDSKFVGEGAKELRKLFDQARMISPAIIFIDEIDAISGRAGSQQTVNELLTQMDGFVKEANVIVIGATNVLHEVDYRLRRPGRFSRIITIELPNEEERRGILELYINKLPLVDHDSVPYDRLVMHTKNFSSAGLRTLVNDAAMQACKEESESVEEAHFLFALNRALRTKKMRHE